MARMRSTSSCVARASRSTTAACRAGRSALSTRRRRVPYPAEGACPIRAKRPCGPSCRALPNARRPNLAENTTAVRRSSTAWSLSSRLTHPAEHITTARCSSAALSLGFSLVSRPTGADRATSVAMQRGGQDVVPQAVRGKSLKRTAIDTPALSLSSVGNPRASHPIRNDLHASAHRRCGIGNRCPPRRCETHRRCRRSATPRPASFSTTVGVTDVDGHACRSARCSAIARTTYCA